MSKAMKYLFGRHGRFCDPLKNITVRLEFPIMTDDDKRRTIVYPSNEGIIFYLIKRIEKLEKKVNNK